MFYVWRKFIRMEIYLNNIPLILNNVSYVPMDNLMDICILPTQTYKQGEKYISACSKNLLKVFLYPCQGFFGS